ncbi:MAG TPA: M13-type metalloendopeptidase [Steroidobacteraceae bacterium]|nr:M13-type metalloendopeptidase [Steroidobacteraceae bacterium]
MKVRSLSCAVAAVLLIAGCAHEPKASKEPVASTTAPEAPVRSSGIVTENIDKAVRPQDDFYRFVNGQWLAKTPIPPDRSNYGTFTLLQEAAERDLRSILEEAAAQPNKVAGSDSQKIGDYYASFMDEAKVESLGLKPLAAELARVDRIGSKKDLAQYIGYGERAFIGHPFAYFVSIDEKNSTQYTSVLYQSGLSMPDRDYYLSDKDEMKKIREKYRQYVADLLAAAGTPNAKPAAEKVVRLETQLAQVQWTKVQNRDAEKTYNKYDMAGLQKLMPHLDWSAFMAGAQIPPDKVDGMVVSQPSFFEGLDKLIANTPVADWRAYFRYKVLDTYAPDLPAKFVQLSFDFHERTMSGIEEMKPRWKRGVDTVENAIGELAGKVYVKEHFTPEAKRRIDELVSNLKVAYSQGIDDLQWMSPATKQKAHAKLALFTTKIGYPDKWRDWSKLEVRPDDLIGNELRAAGVIFDRNIDKLGGPIDKTEWFMTPQTVNAYYNPPANEIVFPAAILQPPFFQVDADDAINYGAIGGVIGHEISHGFDDQGRRYDGHGNLNDWWAPSDNEEFTKRAQALGAQYSALSPLPGMHVNGDLTMGENIADLAGISMAYRAYKLSLGGKPAPVIDGFTGDQRFFIGWAQGWARKYRDDEMRKRLLTDPHSPSEYRTNAVVMNVPQFFDAFQIKPEDKMWRAPEERVTIW